MEASTEKTTVLIIGAGIGGIAAAARLRRSGYHVTVVEKCEKSGGRCGQMTVQGHRFDTGATLFLMPELYAETYAALGDTLEDLPAGFVNIPVEDIQKLNICLEDVENESFRLWVREQVERARVYFRAGKRYIDSLDVLRCKLAGTWYCTRFEWFLNAIQRDGYRLRGAYPERQSLATWVEMVRLGFTITLRHIAGRIQRGFPHPGPRVAMGAEGNSPSYRVK